LEKARDNFKAHFTMDHSLYRTQTRIAQASVFHTTNHAHRGMQANMLAGHSEAITVISSATVSEPGAVSTPISTNATLSSHLAEKAAELLAANETIRFLRAGKIGGGGLSGTPNSTRATRGGSGCMRPVTDNDNYC
jgi:hypothetical protein